MVHKGTIPVGMCVCHECDTPLCINPDHLWLGGYSDNVRDMIKKGRQNYNPVKKLTDAQVDALRNALAGGEKQGAIAARFGVGQAYVSMVKNGRRRHAASAVLAAPNRASLSG